MNLKTWLYNFREEKKEHAMAGSLKNNKKLILQFYYENKTQKTEKKEFSFFFI